MTLTANQIAEAFSTHRFALAYPHLSPDVRWNNVGGDVVVGREAVVAKCEESSRYLATVSTELAELRTIPAGEHVVVESVASYTEPGGEVSTVASCDVYRFAGDEIAAITSYNVELASR